MAMSPTFLSVATWPECYYVSRFCAAIEHGVLCGTLVTMSSYEHLAHRLAALNDVCSRLYRERSTALHGAELSYGAS